MSDDRLMQDASRPMFDALAGKPDALLHAREAAAAIAAERVAAVPAEPVALPDPLKCRACVHPQCGRFDGPRSVECRAMADGACARERAAPQATPPAPAVRHLTHLDLDGVRYVGSAPPAAPADHVRMPTNEAEAELMAKLGYHWLRVHAPHKLTKPEAPPAAPAPAPQPLTRAQVMEIGLAAGYDGGDPKAKADFINGIRHAERAHGITGGANGGSK